MALAAVSTGAVSQAQAQEARGVTVQKETRREADAHSASQRKRSVEQFISSMPGGSTEAGKIQRDLAENRRKIAEAAVEKMSMFDHKLRYVVDSKTEDVLVNVIDSNTNKVIKVLPPEELRRINRGLPVNELAGGMGQNEEKLVDQLM
jgi:flagellar protein FlaG